MKKKKKQNVNSISCLSDRGCNFIVAPFHWNINKTGWFKTVIYDFLNNSCTRPLRDEES